MTTDDAPRPALDAALLGQLRQAVEQLRGVRYRAEGEHFRAETIILNNADALLAAAARAEAAASENDRLRAALGYIAANQNRMSSVDAGRAAATALALQEGDGNAE